MQTVENACLGLSLLLQQRGGDVIGSRVENDLDW